ncbi:winged helix-turn-helix transcriptional regulator [Sphingopyxis sp. MSC1_008]|jgi:DNA-binding HxlR family transcriptional regulator|uniref:winged helix-turn-helix transcriptional regulator n=1 Tax=Sphingopyxis sp. MSC1_008 TaxID=2909265 RepID=UPI0020BFCECE|nr:helix-turn-helix domain-containing protein [Sphingopyxis sp. MSC1_008]
MAKLPVPGQPVRGSRSGAPIMALFDLLGRRWAMGVLWTLSEGGAMTFRELQDRCETISPSVLNHRLRELKEAGFVAKSDRGYVPTPLGERIYQQLLPLGATARDWSDALGENRPM